MILPLLKGNFPNPRVECKVPQILTKPPKCQWPDSSCHHSPGAGKIIWMFPKMVVPPKSSILIGFSVINHPFWGTTIFGNIHIQNKLPSRRLTVRPWKVTFPNRKGSLFQASFFQGASCYSSGVCKASESSLILLLVSKFCWDLVNLRGLIYLKPRIVDE